MRDHLAPLQARLSGEVERRVIEAYVPRPHASGDIGRPRRGRTFGATVSLMRDAGFGVRTGRLPTSCGVGTSSHS